MRVSGSLLASLARLKLVRKMLGFPRESVVYMNQSADYDSSHAEAVLAEEGITCPEVGSYLGTLVDWYLKNRHRKELQIPVD